MVKAPLTNTLTGKCIAITRPVDQAKKLSALIEQAGGTAILLPLIEITELNGYSKFNAAISLIEQYNWAIFISSNAVQNGMSRLTQQHGIPKSLKFAAIGPITAKELESFGVKNVLTPLSHVQNSDENKVRFDSEALLDLPEMNDVQGKKIIIFRGVGGREVLADTLKQRGATIIFAECYQRTNPQKDCKVLEKLWADKKLHSIVVTSSEAMRHLIDLAADESWLKNTPIFVNHARVAELPLSLGLMIHVAETAGDDAMLKSVMAILSLQDSHK